MVQRVLSPAPSAMTGDHRQSRHRLLELDGLRAVAVVLVLLFHTNEAGPFVGGSLGVDIFFVISGYLIASQLLDPATRISAFLLRRLARLWPVLLAAGAVVCLAAATTQESARAVVPSTFYFLNEMVAYGFPLGRYGMLAHTWTLSIEMQFYLVWAAAWSWMLKRRRRATVCVVAVSVAVASYLVRLSDVLGGQPGRAYFSTESHVDGLFVGVALAMVLAGGRRGPTRIWDPLLVLLIGAVGWCVLDMPIPHPANLLVGIPIAIAFSGVVVVAAAREAPSVILRVLRTRILVAIGLRSYGIYVWHIPVFVAIAHTGRLHGWALYLAQWVVALIVAEISYRMLEVPARVYLYRRISAHGDGPGHHVVRDAREVT